MAQMNDEDIMNILEVNAKLALQIQQRLKTVKFDLDGGHAIVSYHDFHHFMVLILMPVLFLFIILLLYYEVKL